MDLFDAARRGDLERIRSILNAQGDLVHQRDDSGATPLHYAALHGHRDAVKLLVQRGAEVNSTDARFRATPTGWAIEYLRELGGFLATDLDDLSYAIHQGDARWVARFLERFPTLRHARDAHGKPFQQVAHESRNQRIVELFLDKPGT